MPFIFYNNFHLLTRVQIKKPQCFWGSGGAETLIHLRQAVRNIVAYCRKFPTALMRRGVAKNALHISRWFPTCIVKKLYIHIQTCDVKVFYKWCKCNDSHAYSHRSPCINWEKVSQTALGQNNIYSLTSSLWITWTPLASNHPLCSPWKYNSDVEEFFVEDETVVKLKKSDVTRRLETTDVGDRDLVDIWFTISSCHLQKWQSITGRDMHID